MDELKSTISILGDEISDFRERADNILNDVYGKIEEQAEYIDQLERALLDLARERDEDELKQALLDPAFDYDEEELKDAAFNAREIHILVDNIRDEHHKRWLKEKEAERRANMTEEERTAEYEAGQAFIKSAVDDLVASDIEWTDHNEDLDIFRCRHIAEIKARTGTDGFQADKIAAKVWHRLRGTA